MSSYSKNFRNATREAFAREAALEAFGHRALWALDDAGFEDRSPNETPSLAAEVLARLEMLGVGMRQHFDVRRNSRSWSRVGLQPSEAGVARRQSS